MRNIYILLLTSILSISFAYAQEGKKDSSILVIEDYTPGIEFKIPNELKKNINFTKEELASLCGFSTAVVAFKADKDFNVIYSFSQNFNKMVENKITAIFNKWSESKYLKQYPELASGKLLGIQVMFLFGDCKEEYNTYSISNYPLIRKFYSELTKKGDIEMLSFIILDYSKK